MLADDERAVYVGSGADVNGTLYAVNASTGAPIWNFTAGAITASPTLSPDQKVVYIGSMDKKLESGG